jgi:thiol-disulfide isomerase/thioredoxin
MAPLVTFGVGFTLLASSPGLCLPLSSGQAPEGREGAGAAASRQPPFSELREDFRGKVVLLHFWASWCGHCAAEVPHLKELRRRFRDRDFEIVGVCLDSGPRRHTHRWLRRHRIPWRQIFDIRDYRGELSRRLQVSAPPASLLFDRQGRILARSLPPESLFEAVRSALDAGGGLCRPAESAPRPP